MILSRINLLDHLFINFDRLHFDNLHSLELLSLEPLFVHLIFDLSLVTQDVAIIEFHGCFPEKWCVVCRHLKLRFISGVLNLLGICGCEILCLTKLLPRLSLILALQLRRIWMRRVSILPHRAQFISILFALISVPALFFSDDLIKDVSTWWSWVRKWALNSRHFNLWLRNIKIVDSQTHIIHVGQRRVRICETLPRILDLHMSDIWLAGHDLLHQSGLGAERLIYNPLGAHHF